MEKEELIAGTANNVKEAKSTRSLRGHWLRPKRVILGGLLILVVAAIVFAIATGRLVIRLKDPAQRVVIASQVCSDTTVNSYNNAMELYYADETDQAISKMASIVAGFSNNKTYAGDATCQYIRFKLYLLEQNYTKAKDALTLLKPLIDQGVYINGKISGLNSIDQLDSLLNEIRPRDEGRPSDG